MALVSDVPEHIRRINSPLNLANMKIQTFVRNTAPDYNQGFKLHAQPLLAHILV